MAISLAARCSAYVPVHLKMRLPRNWRCPKILQDWSSRAAVYARSGQFVEKSVCYYRGDAYDFYSEVIIGSWIASAAHQYTVEDVQVWNFQEIVDTTSYQGIICYETVSAYSLIAFFVVYRNRGRHAGRCSGLTLSCCGCRDRCTTDQSVRSRSGCRCGA